ncbi:Phosphatidylserine decarboxylase proenzyme [Paragonimus heterotremus]|uniref:phosphatidylserine decarboxylase n=1 Tax=Paragonimus heterotremus TaxID=100268 RepID=A0A8J4SN27_9TREM|nr:Phosphatidylserine decarboxylase proenzyme [Paragonimus heterotremus]
MFRLMYCLRTLSRLSSRNFHGLQTRTASTFRYPPFLGSSVVVGTYLGFLLLTDREQSPEYYPSTLNQATLVRRLPLNATSRLICWLAECRIPVSLRPFVYNSYSSLFHCDLKELKNSDLKSYPSVADFFTREVSPSYRPVDRDAALVSPADGQVVYFGPVDRDGVLEQVKGVNYSLSEFLGPTSLNTDQRVSGRKLYQCVIYLSPGDCHRFYSPTEWTASIRRHFPGKLLSVNPRLAARLPGLFTLNERVVYLGKWSYGFMAFAAVGAMGVGGIHINADSTVTTNKKSHQSIRARSVGSAISPFIEGSRVITFDKGNEFGQFRFGSTIVLVFEAPSDAAWCVHVGDRIRFGEALLKAPSQVKDIFNG